MKNLVYTFLYQNKLLLGTLKSFIRTGVFRNLAKIEIGPSFLIHISASNQQQALQRLIQNLQRY